MDAKEAVAIAKNYLRDLFEDESIADLGLEEVQHTGTHWEVTLGFSRPWDKPSNTFAHITKPHRSYKIVRITGEGLVESVRNREVDSR